VTLGELIETARDHAERLGLDLDSWEVCVRVESGQWEVPLHLDVNEPSADPHARVIYLDTPPLDLSRPTLDEPDNVLIEQAIVLLQEAIA
jgi:hypothetical protein